MSVKGVARRVRGRRRAATGRDAAPLSDSLLAAAVGVLAVVVFLPAVQNGFVLWDDDRMFLENHHYRGLGWSRLTWMWTTFHVGHWMPLTWMSLALDHAVWGMNPAGYHLTSVLLHGVNAALACLLALRLLRRALGPDGGDRAGTIQAGGAVAALLWALHPLRVESVAWATERRDVLCALFYLAAILAYLRAVDGPSSRGTFDRRWHGAALGLFVLALLSKSMAASLPVVLLILNGYPLRRLGGAKGGLFGRAARLVWLEKIPFVALSLGAGVVALVALSASGNASTVSDVTPAGRVAIALYGLAFYLRKSLVPLDLSPLYERQGLAELAAWPVLASAVVVAGVTACAVRWRRRWPALAAVWAAYVVMLLPVLGAVPNGHQIAADRYTYLATLGWGLLAGAALIRIVKRPPRLLARAHAAPVAGAVGVGVLAVLAALTWDQIAVWRTSETLWSHALRVDPGSAMALNNLGAVRSGQGRQDEALALFQRAVTVRPGYAAAQFNWGHALAARGQLEPAIERFQAAIRLEGSYAAPHNDWGLALVRLGRPADAVAHFREALRIRPDFATAHSNWGLAELALGRRAEAADRFARALAIDPEHVEAHYNLGYALAEEGRLDEAMARFQAVVRVKPDHAAAHNDWGLALIRRGRPHDAVERLEAAVRIRPDLAMAHSNLGMALMHLGRPAEAIERFRRATELAPELALPHANWGLALTQQGHAAAAAERFRRALQIDPALGPELQRARENLAAVLAGGGTAPTPSAMMNRPRQP